jgi:hypothetical protein
MHFKIGSVVWAIVIGAAFICLGVSVMLPSTKRARFDHRQLMNQQTEPATTTRSTKPASTNP